jgi:hypothetical protein
VTLVLPVWQEIKEKTCIIKRTSKNYYNYTKREGAGGVACAVDDDDDDDDVVCLLCIIPNICQ